MSDNEYEPVKKEVEKIKQLRKSMADAADGDLTTRVDVTFENAELNKLSTQYNEMLSRLESQQAEIWSFAGGVRSTGDTVTGDSLTVDSATDRITAEFDDVTDRTEEQKERLRNVSDEADRLSASIEEIASEATEVAERANEAAERGSEGRQAAEQAIEQTSEVKDISESTVAQITELQSEMEDVAETVDLISDIADQTNLLALNASIEAARAGEEGNSFGVVADEVKQLAEEAQQSADKIESVVNTVIQETEETVTEVRRANESIGESTQTVQEALAAFSDTVDYVEDINYSIQEISDATDQQAQSNSSVASEVDEVLDLSRAVNEQIESVEDATENQARLAGQISSQMSGLQSDVTSLESSLETFAINDWGQRINEHCRSAGIDWRQCEGDSITFVMSDHMFTQATQPFLDYFTDLTGIDVTYDIYPEEELFSQIEHQMRTERSSFDGFLLGLWAASNYNQSGWVKDLNQFRSDASLTDATWYHMEDYPDNIIEKLSYGRNDLIALPVVIGSYGCVAYDRPTFEQLGIEEPTNFEELTHAAKVIHESDSVDRCGISSRGSADPVSTANWSTLFKSYGADWVDRRTGEAALNSPEGVASLEKYAELLRSYGPRDATELNWYRANETFGRGDAGILYHSPATAGVLTDEQYNRTKWLPPLDGPGGKTQAGVWTWSLGINQFAPNPEAAWLFLQWATSREMSLLLSTRQWEGHDSAGYARTNWIPDQQEYAQRGQASSWDDAFNQAVDSVPSDPPPVPLDLPQNMELMDVAAEAMNTTIRGDRTAQEALDTAASEMNRLLNES